MNHGMNHGSSMFISMLRKCRPLLSDWSFVWMAISSVMNPTHQNTVKCKPEVRWTAKLLKHLEIWKYLESSRGVKIALDLYILAQLTGTRRPNHQSHRQLNFEPSTVTSRLQLWESGPSTCTAIRRPTSYLKAKRLQDCWSWVVSDGFSLWPNSMDAGKLPMRTSTGMWAKWKPKGVSRSCESFSSAPIATLADLSRSWQRHRDHHRGRCSQAMPSY